VLLKMPVIVHLANNPKPCRGFYGIRSARAVHCSSSERDWLRAPKFILENAKTQEKVEVNVVRPPQMNQDGSLVPVEFLSPAPKFWNIFFPPNIN